MRAIIVPLTAGVCVMRDVADIALLVCAHYLRIGLARIIVIDDGSSDGTHERLQRLAMRSGGRLTVQRHLSDDDNQPDLFTSAANALIAEGYRLILPFDADEFWDISAADLARLVREPEPRFIVGEWVNFVQARGRTYPTPFGLFAMRHRVGARMKNMQAKVCGFEEPFIHVSEQKVAIWSDAPVEIARGQHKLVTGPKLKAPDVFEIFHVPLRYRSELTKRALNYEPRRARLRIRPSVSWQSAFHLKALMEDRDGDVWAANSAGNDGRLDVYGRPENLVPDRRLQCLLWRAAVHLVGAQRTSPF